MLNADGGPGGLTFRVPGKIALRVEYEHVAAGINPGSRLHLVRGDRNRDAVYETENFGSAELRHHVDCQWWFGIHQHR